MAIVNPKPFSTKYFLLYAVRKFSLLLLLLLFCCVRGFGWGFGFWGCVGVAVRGLRFAVDVGDFRGLRSCGGRCGGVEVIGDPASEVRWNF